MFGELPIDYRGVAALIYELCAGSPSSGSEGAGERLFNTPAAARPRPPVRHHAELHGNSKVRCAVVHDGASAAECVFGAEMITPPRRPPSWLCFPLKRRVAGAMSDRHGAPAARATLVRSGR